MVEISCRSQLEAIHVMSRISMANYLISFEKLLWVACTRGGGETKSIFNSFDVIDNWIDSLFTILPCQCRFSFAPFNRQFNCLNYFENVWKFSICLSKKFLAKILKIPSRYSSSRKILFFFLSIIYRIFQHTRAQISSRASEFRWSKHPFVAVGHYSVMAHVRVIDVICRLNFLSPSFNEDNCYLSLSRLIFQSKLILLCVGWLRMERLWIDKILA